jgi:catalase
VLKIPKIILSIRSSYEDEKNRTAAAIAGALGGARQDIQMRQLCHFFRANIDYGMRVAKVLSINIDPSMLQQNQQNNPQSVPV